MTIPTKTVTQTPKSVKVSSKVLFKTNHTMNRASPPHPPSPKKSSLQAAERVEKEQTKRETNRDKD